MKRPLRIYLAAIAIFCNAQRGKSMLAMSRDLGLSYKAAFVLCHKMREAKRTVAARCNGAPIKLAPHVLFERHGDLFVSALNLTKPGGMTRPRGSASSSSPG